MLRSYFCLVAGLALQGCFPTSPASQKVNNLKLITFAFEPDARYRGAIFGSQSHHLPFGESPLIDDEYNAQACQEFGFGRTFPSFFEHATNPFAIAWFALQELLPSLPRSSASSSGCVP